jgi:hypothetical protein
MSACERYADISQQEIIAEIYVLSMAQPSSALDIFLNISGHINSVQIQVIKNCDYLEVKPENKLLDVILYQDHDNFTQELGAALSSINQFIADHKALKLLEHNNHLVASVHSVRSHPRKGFNA